MSMSRIRINTIIKSIIKSTHVDRSGDGKRDEETRGSRFVGATRERPRRNHGEHTGEELRESGAELKMFGGARHGPV